MAKFTIAATVNDPTLTRDAKFEYRILDNNNYIIDSKGGVTAKSGYKPKDGDKFTVEVTYRFKDGKVSKAQKTFTVI